MKFLGIIPARGGSKGLPKKNVALILGKPMIQYTIEAALHCRRLDRVLLSTEDPEILHVGRHFESLGLDCSYLRPPDLASDTATMVDTILDAIRWLRETRSQAPDHVVLLQPTSPLRTAEDIDNGIALYESTSADSLVAVSEMSEHPYKCVEETDQGWKYLRQPSLYTARRQEYKEKFYCINGLLYVRKTQDLIRERILAVPGRTVLFKTPAERSIDVDNIIDLKMAEAVLAHLTANRS